MAGRVDNHTEYSSAYSDYSSGNIQDPSGTVPAGHSAIRTNGSQGIAGECSIDIDN
jgi:hypothetical protein